MTSEAKGLLLDAQSVGYFTINETSIGVHIHIHTFSNSCYRGKVLNTSAQNRGQVTAAEKSAGHDGWRGCGQVLSNVFKNVHKFVQICANTIPGCNVALKMGGWGEGRGGEGERGRERGGGGEKGVLECMVLLS